MTLPLNHQLDDEDVAIIHESGFIQVFTIKFKFFHIFLLNSAII